MRVTGAESGALLPTGASVSGSMLTLTFDEDLEMTSPASASGSAVFVAVLRAPGPQRSISTARGTGAQASGRTVSMTLDPPARYGETVTLSYLRDNATPETRVRDANGNLADDFAGFRVRNQTPRGPHVEAIAFAGAAQTYAIGDVLAVDLTFSESVTVTGAPTLLLTIGSQTRSAVWRAGQGAGTTHRFEYTIAEGDLDTDGVTVRANGLALVPGATLLTTARERPGHPRARLGARSDAPCGRDSPGDRDRSRRGGGRGPPAHPHLHRGARRGLHTGRGGGIHGGDRRDPGARRPGGRARRA